MEKIQSVLTTIKQWLQTTDYYMTTQTDIESEKNHVFYFNLIFYECKISQLLYWKTLA